MSSTRVAIEMARVKLLLFIAVLGGLSTLCCASATYETLSPVGRAWYALFNETGLGGGDKSDVTSSGPRALASSSGSGSEIASL